MMCYKHHYETEKETEKENVFIQKIKDLDGYDLILITVGILLVILLSSYSFRTNKKTVKIPQTMVQSQILSKEQLNKKDVYINETAKLNSKNFELFISEKDSNRGLILIKSSDFIKNNNKIILYKATKKIKISGNPEIIEKLNFNISNNSNVNLKKNTIQIELDSNRHDNSILNLQINPELLTKDSIINDETLLTIEYVESYVE